MAAYSHATPSFCILATFVLIWLCSCTSTGTQKDAGGRVIWHPLPRAVQHELSLLRGSRLALRFGDLLWQFCQEQGRHHTTGEPRRWRLRASPPPISLLPAAAEIPIHPSPPGRLLRRARLEHGRRWWAISHPSSSPSFIRSDCRKLPTCSPLIGCYDWILTASVCRFIYIDVLHVLVLIGLRIN
jgi:hypothetical protein